MVLSGWSRNPPLGCASLPSDGRKRRKRGYNFPQIARFADPISSLCGPSIEAESSNHWKDRGYHSRRPPDVGRICSGHDVGPNTIKTESVTIREAETHL